MVLGQLVAISVSTSLFITALLLHPRVSLEPAKAPVRLWLPLALAMATIHLVPQYVGTDRFLNNLLWMHGLLVVPLLTSPERGILDIPFPAIYTLLPLLGTGVHIPNTIRLLRALPQNRTMSSQLYQTILAHPAQSSISLDVIWVAISISAWFLTTGSTFSIALKSIVSAILAFVVITSQTGVNWAFVVNLIPIVILAAVGAIYLGLGRIWTRNSERRIELLASLGIVENSVIAGTEEKPPSRSGRRTVVGFWHPYWLGAARLSAIGSARLMYLQ